MRKLVFVLAVAMVVVGVVVYDRNNATQPQLINPPVLVHSEGVVRICAQDKVRDEHTTKVTASTGRLENAGIMFYNTGLDQDGLPSVIIQEDKQCWWYVAPAVKKETLMQLRVWQDGKKTDQATVTLLPDRF